MISACEVCERTRLVSVVPLPGIELSVAKCWECERAGAIPWPVLVSVTVDMGGTKNAESWWFEVIHATVFHLGRSCEELEQVVALVMETLAN